MKLAQVHNFASTCASEKVRKCLRKCAILAQVRKRASTCASAQLRKCVSPQVPAQEHLRKCASASIVCNCVSMQVLAQKAYLRK